MDPPSPTTAELTVRYIKDHPDIKRCLSKGIINYSSLARLIAQETGREKMTSKEAILIAARRFAETIRKDKFEEKKIHQLLFQSEIEVRNKIAVVILEKGLSFDAIEKLQKNITQNHGVFYLIEGSRSYTLITQTAFVKEVKDAMKTKVIQSSVDLSFVIIKSPESIEKIPGVLSYLAGLFAENGVNIVELLSCWRDTLVVVEGKDVNRVLAFLHF